MNKDVKKILWVTALYSFAGGLFYNFIELWLLSNKFTTSENIDPSLVSEIITRFNNGIYL